MDTRGSGRAAAPSERFNPRTFSGAVGATGHVQERSEPHHLHVEANLMSLINPSLEHIYCSYLVSNHVLIRLIRFVPRFTVHLYNIIYFLIIFSTPYKQFAKILHFAFTEFKHGLTGFSSQLVIPV